MLSARLDDRREGRPELVLVMMVVMAVLLLVVCGLAIVDVIGLACYEADLRMACAYGPTALAWLAAQSGA